MNRQERIRRTPRRRPMSDDIPALQTAPYAPDTSEADDLLARIAALLETL